MESPWVTVVIPVRNGLEHLPAALESVRAQEVEGLEVIVIDDGSTDGTAGWLADQRTRWPALRVLTGFGDGPNTARNRGIAAARTPLIAFLDADDRWVDGKLAAQLAAHADDPNLVFSFTDYRHVDPAGGDHGNCFAFWPCFARHAARPGAGWHRLDRATPFLLAENVVGTSTVVARRDALRAVGGFDASLVSAADWDLWLRLSGLGAVGFTAQIGMSYLMRPGSVSSNTAARLACMRRIVARNRDACGRKDGWALRRAWARIYTGEAEHAAAQGARRAALLRHLAATCLAPSRRAMRATAAAAMALAWRG